MTFDKDEPITEAGIARRFAGELCPECHRALYPPRIYHVTLPPGFGPPCAHPGCMNHVTHPCEGCGRIWGGPGEVILVVCDHCKKTGRLSFSYPMQGGVEMTIRWRGDHDHDPDSPRP